MRFVCVPDEESEDIDTRSIDEIVRGGFPADFAITGEPTDLHVGVQAKGVLAFRLHVHGRSAHGSTPWLGDNAVLKAIDVFRRIESLPFSRESSELFDRPSVNLGRIQGGDALNKVPDLCTDGRRHPLPAQPGPRRHPRADPLDPRHRGRARRSRACPAYVSRSNPYVIALVAAVGRLTEGESMSVGRDGASRRGLVPAGGHPGGRVRSRRRRPPRARRVGLDLLARPLPPGAVRLRGAAAGLARAGPTACAPSREGSRESDDEGPAPGRPGPGLARPARRLPDHADDRRRRLGGRAAAGRRHPRHAARAGPRGDRDPGDRPRRRRQGADADDPRLRPPLRRQGGRHPAALGHDHPRPAGPGQGGDRDDLDPARPARRRSPASAAA